MFHLVLIYFPAASHTLLYANHLLQQGYLLSFGNMSLLQAIRCCMLIMYCSKVLFHLVLIYFPAASHTLLYANHILQQGNLLSFGNMSLLQAIRCCMLIMYCSKVLFYLVLIYFPAASYCCMLIIYCSKVIFYRLVKCPCCKLYVVVC